MYNMKAIEKVYNSLSANKKSVGEIVDGTKIGRTYVSALLKKLQANGKVSSEKVGRKIYYFRSDRVVFLDEDLKLKASHEDIVWLRAWDKLKNQKSYSEQAIDILNFSFTEMLNNSIDHSKSGSGSVKIWLEEGILKFIVRDFGIGIFKNVQSKRKLNTEYDAVWEILKGKITTDPKNHSGEGVFWTSKIADKLIIESYNLRLTIDNNIEDYAIEELEDSVLGTKIFFEISAKTKKSMYDLFHSYSFDSEKINLDTTVIPIKLYQNGDEAWISRSQAKKILQGLEKFKKITLDFRDIRLIGQGFADEIFRVWQIKHPDIILEAINTNEVVGLLIERARNDRTGRE